MSVEPVELVDLISARAVVVAAVVASSDAAGRRCGAPDCEHAAALALILAAVEDPHDPERVYRLNLENSPTLPFCWSCWQELGLPNLWRLKPGGEGSDTPE